MNEKTRKSRAVFGAQDISLFCMQLSMILHSGLPLQDGVSAISETAGDRKACAVIDGIGSALAGGATFHQALKDSGAFPSYMVGMVEIGEKAGRLDQVMASLGAYYDREARLRSSIRSAVGYPLVLVLMMAAVIAVLVGAVFPVFQQVYEGLGAEMSGISSFMMNIGLGVAQWSFVVLLVLVVLFGGALIYSKTRRGAGSFTRFLARFAPTRGLSSKLASARFASVMSMMLSSGYDTDEALKLVPGVLGNEQVVRKVEHAREKIAAGSSFAAAITDAGLFPGIYGQMIAIGVRTGNLDQVLKELADIYDRDVSEAIDRAVSVIEPVLVGVLSIIIGAILLSVMLPLMSIMSSIG